MALCFDSDQGLGSGICCATEKKSKRQELHEIEHVGHEKQGNHMQRAVQHAKDYRCENSRAHLPTTKQHEVKSRLS